MYSNGTGVKRDHEKALALLLIARGRPGLNTAAHQQINALMTVLRTNLNSTQISRAEWHAAQVMGATL
jgi:hypothetical protein